MQTADTLIHARWVIPVEPHGLVLENHAVAIGNGRIEAILPSAEADTAWQATTTRHLDNHALIPGLVNTHTHAAMTLLRGYADDLPLMTWLNDHIWPAESKHVDREFVTDGTRHAIAEMLRSGITCFNDMYFFPDETARVASETGIRAVVGLIVLDFPTAWAGDASEYLSRAIEVHDQLRDVARVTTAFAPHSPYAVSDEPLQKIVTLAEEMNLPVHMHVHETSDEIAQSIEACGKRPIARLAELGLLSPRLIAVHMTQVQADEMTLLAEQGVQVVHCPESNMKLASGLCPVQTLIDQGINVALGTDGPASNNDLDLFGEMRSAALLAKATSNDATAVPAATALRMATLNGARALDLDSEIGSIEPGKAADLTAVDLNDPATQPVYDPVSTLVYACGRHQVSDVWVAGEALLQDHELTTLDSAGIIDQARNWSERIRNC